MPHPDPDHRGAWHEFLQRSLPDDETRDALQLFLGAAIAGDAAEVQVALVVHGPPNSGKTTFLHVLKNVLGDEYVGAFAARLIEQTGGGIDNRPSAAIALDGRRIAILAEWNKTKKLDPAAFKAITGGDEIEAKRLWRDPYHFRNRAMLLLGVNNPPTPRDFDEAIMRRLVLVPFSYTLPDAEIEFRFPDRLIRDHGPEVVRWLLTGAARWWRQRTTLTPAAMRSPVMMAEAQAYREDNDDIGNFIADHIQITGRREDLIPNKQLFSLWRYYIGKPLDHEATIGEIRPFLRDLKRAIPDRANGVEYGVTIDVAGDHNERVRARAIRGIRVTP